MFLFEAKFLPDPASSKLPLIFFTDSLSNWYVKIYSQTCQKIHSTRVDRNPLLCDLFPFAVHKIILDISNFRKYNIEPSRFLKVLWASSLSTSQNKQKDDRSISFKAPRVYVLYALLVRQNSNTRTKCFQSWGWRWWGWCQLSKFCARTKVTAHYCATTA